MNINSILRLSINPAERADVHRGHQPKGHPAAGFGNDGNDHFASCVATIWPRPLLARIVRAASAFISATCRLASRLIAGAAAKVAGVAVLH
jgi:hypothetical protein